MKRQMLIVDALDSWNKWEDGGKKKKDYKDGNDSSFNEWNDKKWLLKKKGKNAGDDSKWKSNHGSNYWGKKKEAKNWGHDKSKGEEKKWDTDKSWGDEKVWSDEGKSEFDKSNGHKVSYYEDKNKKSKGKEMKGKAGKHTHWQEDHLDKKLHSKGNDGQHDQWWHQSDDTSHLMHQFGGLYGIARRR